MYMAHRALLVSGDSSTPVETTRMLASELVLLLILQDSGGQTGLADVDVTARGFATLKDNVLLVAKVAS